MDKNQDSPILAPPQPLISHDNPSSSKQPPTAPTNFSVLENSNGHSSFSPQKQQPSFQNSSDHQYRLYKTRWLGLILIIALNISNALFWLGFAPIADLTQQYFDVSLTTVNLLATDSLIVYVVLTPFASWALDKWGIKTGLVVGALANTLGGWIRYFATFSHDKLVRIIILYIGQTISSIGNVVFLTVPTNYAMTWFDENGRTTANMLGSVSNPFGGAVTNIIIPLIVSEPDDIPKSLWIAALVATIVLLPTFILPERPPKPPSYSASQPLESFGTGFRKIFKSINYWILLIGFSTVVGFFNGFTALINSIVVPYGYNDNDAGTFGATLIIAGLVGAAIMGPLVDRTHAYKLTLKIVAPMIGVSFLVLSFVMKENNLVAIAIVSGCIGLFSFSLLPVALELGVECTYPVSPNTSASFLWIGGEFLGIIFTIAMDQLRYPEGVGDPPQNSKRSLLLQGIVSLIATSAMVFYRGKNKRREAEKGAGDELVET